MTIIAVPLLLDPEGVFDCHGCGLCCRADWRIPVEGSLVQRGLEEQAVLDEGGYRLRRIQGRCAWLRSDQSCSAHARWGRLDKPLACQIFPFVLTPTPEGTVVGLSFFCPSVQNRQGRPLLEHLPDLQRLSRLAQLPQQLTPPFSVWGDTTTGWSGYQIYEEALLERLCLPDWESQLRTAAMALAGNHKDWGRLPLENLFAGPASVWRDFPLELAGQLAQNLVPPQSTRPLPGNLKAAPPPTGAPPTAAYLRSLVRSKVLLKQPTMLEGLALLCLVSFILDPGCTNWPETLQHLEMLIRHTNHPVSTRDLAAALLPV